MQIHAHTHDRFVHSDRQSHSYRRVAIKVIPVDKIDRQTGREGHNAPTLHEWAHDSRRHYACNNYNIIIIYYLTLKISKTCRHIR